MTHRIKCQDDQGEFYTLSDILPKDDTHLDILAIGKFPAMTSVNLGHYYQGIQGKRFWSNMLTYGILKKVTYFEDDSCLIYPNRIGLTDIFKRPRESGDEPSKREYVLGLRRVCEIIDNYSPKILIFVYKKALDTITRLLPNSPITTYGFNPLLEELFGGRKVFVCPIAGVGGVTSEEIKKHMNELKAYCTRHLS